MKGLQELAADVTWGRSFAGGENHLMEAVSLTSSIIQRYERCGRKPSDAEVEILRRLNTQIDQLLYGSQPSQPALIKEQSSHDVFVSSASPSTGSLSPKSNFLKKFAAVTNAPSLYKDLVTVKTDLDSLSRFVLACSDVSRTPQQLATVIAQEIDSMCGMPTVKNVYLLDSRDEFFVEPNTGDMIKVTDEASPITQCGGCASEVAEGQSILTSFSGSDGLQYFPLKSNGLFLGSIVMQPFLLSNVDAAKQQLVNATISAVSMCIRSQKLVESLRYQVNRAEVMLSMAAQLSRDNLEEAPILVRSIMITAKSLIDSERCSIFIVHGETLTAYFEEGKSVVMDIHVGIAGHVARTGETVNIPDAYCDSRFNPAVDKATGYKTKSILCMPVRYEGVVVAVAQLINKNPVRRAVGTSSEEMCILDRSFSRQDEELFSTFSTFSGVCLRNCRISQNLLNEKRKSEAILDVVTLLSQTDIRDVDSIVGHVMLGAKKLLAADRTSLFLFDKERNELYSNMAHSTGGKEIRIPAGKGIAGTVASSGVGENIADAYNDHRFNREVDMQLGYHTLSILCEPITLNGEVLAVAQLVNKVLPDGTITTFTKDDQETFKTFALFAGISINNSYLLDFAIRAGQEAMELNSAMERPVPARGGNNIGQNAATVVPITPVPSSELNLCSHVVALDQDVTSVDFDIFKVKEMQNPLDKAVAVVMMTFESTGLLEKVKCSRETLLSFVCQCRRRYRTVPYHNFFHVVDVCQTLETFLFAGGASSLLSDTECFVLLITALVHDLDHMGLNNSFYLKTESPLGILSSSSGNKSVLEVHHCNIAIEILSEEASNVFRFLSPIELTAAYRGMIDCILATDMARHEELISSFTVMVEGGYDRSNEQHRRLVMQMLLKAADISNVTKPFEVSKKWAIAVTEEFYQQGDKEKERGVAVLPMFDRTVSTELAKGQLGFINFVAGKFFAKVVTDFFTGLRWTTERIAENTAHWKELLAS